MNDYDLLDLIPFMLIIDDDFDLNTASKAEDKPSEEVNALIEAEYTTLTHKDVINAVNQYAQSMAGYINNLGKTKGFDRQIREQQGKKLWEDMTSEERIVEFKDYAINELKITMKEAKNSVDYLLNRALDPLDPMSCVYKILLKKAGATITDKGIKLSSELEEQRVKELSIIEKGKTTIKIPPK